MGGRRDERGGGVGDGGVYRLYGDSSVETSSARTRGARRASSPLRTP